MDIDGFIEIARSFSYKHNAGNYESRDFFCSAKAQCAFSKADATSAALYQFCKDQVFASVNDYISNNPSSDPRDDAKYQEMREAADKLPVNPEVVVKPIITAAVAGTPAPQPVPPIPPPLPPQEPPPGPRAVANDEDAKYCASLFEHLQTMVFGLTKAHRDQFFLGWFDVDNSRKLPRKAGTYREPLEHLETSLTADYELAKVVIIENPRGLGSRLRKAHGDNLQPLLEQSLAAQEKAHPTPPSEPAQALILTDSDIFDDKLGQHFGWKDIQTSALAKLLMTKWDKDIDSFGKHMTFLQMNKLPELDLQSLFGLLYYDVKAYDLWKKAEQKGLSVHTVAELVAAKLPDHRLTLSNEPRDVVLAITSVIAEI